MDAHRLKGKESESDFQSLEHPYGNLTYRGDGTPANLRLGSSIV